MHRVGSPGNNAASVRPRKEKRLTYVLNDANDTKHCAGVNCLTVLKSSVSDGCDCLFTGNRDGTIKRWAVDEDSVTCSATFESHVDWVNGSVLVGNTTIISCSSDTTLKTWNCLSDGACTRTLRQHSDYVTCLASRERLGSHASSANGSALSGKDVTPRMSFEFSTVSPPSIITEGSQGCPWRKKITEFDGTDDEDFPWWVLDFVSNNRLPPRENTK